MSAQLLKFRTPGLDLRAGLAVGRIVFRALNRVEMGWAAIIAVSLVAKPPSLVAVSAATVSVCLLAGQLGVVRPALNRRSDQVLAGGDAPRSSMHRAYVAIEATKVLALSTLSIGLLSY